jgi:hypothetical protein
MGDPVVVGEGFFEAVGLPLVRGRYLEAGDHDTGAPPVLVVDQAAVDRWWPGEDPVGQRVRFGSTDAPWSTVVGIVGNVTFDGPGELWPHFFGSHNGTAVTAPFVTRSTYLTLRTIGSPRNAVPGIQEVVRGLDPDVAIASVVTIDEVLGQAVARPRFIMTLLSVFAAVAMALGAIGMYGVISYGVALRSGEMGIRRALGAQGWQVVRLVLRQGLFLTVLGVSLGLAASFAGSRVIEGFLHEVSPTDPATYLLVAVGVMAVAGLAAFVPARRASGADPLDALRIE